MRSTARHAAAAARASSSPGVKRNALAADELITAVWVTPRRAPQTFMKVGPRNAMVIAVVSLALVGRRRAARVLRLGRAAPAARDRAARRRRRASPSGSPPPPRRSTTSAAARPTAATPCASSPRGRSSGRSPHEDRAPGQRARGRGRLLGGRVAPLRAARAARLPGLEERLRAGRVRLLLGAARRRARLRLPGARRPGRGPRGDDGRGPRRAASACIRCRRRSCAAGAVQCGFCTPGLVVAAADLLARCPDPSDGRDPRGAVGQPLPLHRLREDLRRRSARRRRRQA